MKQIEICNVKIHSTTLPRAVDYALSGEHSPCWVVTPNALMLDACKKEPQNAALLSSAHLSLPDGAGVLLVAKRQKEQFLTRIAGIDFGEALLGCAAEEGLRVFLLGGEEGVAEAAADGLRVALALFAKYA